MEGRIDLKITVYLYNNYQRSDASELHEHNTEEGRRTCWSGRATPADIPVFGPHCRPGLQSAVPAGPTWEAASH